MTVETNPPPIEEDVCRVDDNTLDTGTIPLVFVPGVMGSRLHFPVLDQSWDPDSNWAMVHWIRISAERSRRELATNNPAEVMTDNDELTQAQRDRGWAGVAWSFYGRFVRDLQARRFGRYNTPVYVIGYDWRQSNRDSGNAVATRINEILAAEGVDRFVLISHSMGGLVTRACLKAHADVRGKCLGVIHIAQPVHGGVVLVRRLFTGAHMASDGGYNVGAYGFTTILGDNRQRAITIASGMAGPLQLLVTPNYRDCIDGDPLRPTAWYFAKTFERPGDGYQEWPGRSWDLYAMPQSPPGLLPPADKPYSPGATARRDFTRNLTRARDFHDWLGLWKYTDKTWAIYSTGLRVDTRIPFDLPPESVRLEVLPGDPMMGGGGQMLYVGRRADGSEAFVSDPDPEDRGCHITQLPHSDGTVPKMSARGLFPNEGHPVRRGSDYNTRHQFEIDDPTHEAAAHDAICHHPQCETATFDIIDHLLGI